MKNHPVTPPRRRLLVAGAAVAGAAAVAPLGALAQQIRVRPSVRILVGAPAGGTTDTMARTLSLELARALNKPVIVENRPGAGGNAAADAVARALPDGNTLLMSFTSHAINASLYKQLPFDPVRDFTPLTLVSTSPSMLVCHPSLPVKDLKELVAYARANPGKLNFAIGAIGSSLHLAGDLFKMMAKVFIVNIPYKGTAPAVQDVLGGQVELMFAAVGNVQQHVRAGKLRALGVTSPRRLADFPDVPAIAEVVPGYESSAWFGLFAPGFLSPALTQELSDAARRAIATPAVQERIRAEGAVPVGNSPDEFKRFVESEIKRWAVVVKYSGAQPE